MKGIIRLHDKTSHGGKVLNASSTLICQGLGVARVGDFVSCPIEGHGPTTQIIEGDNNFKDQGIPIAFEGHKCACGCVLISSVSTIGTVKLTFKDEIKFGS